MYEVMRIEWDNFNDPIRIDIGLLILNKYQFHVQYLFHNFCHFKLTFIFDK